MPTPRVKYPVLTCCRCGTTDRAEFIPSAIKASENPKGTRKAGAVCRPCQRAYRKAWASTRPGYWAKFRRKRKANYRELLNNIKTQAGCVGCGENHVACLEFHHRDQAQKAFTISIAVARTWPLQSILAEVAKCDVICANCHRKHHYDELGKVPDRPALAIPQRERGKVADKSWNRAVARSPEIILPPLSGHVS